MSNITGLLQKYKMIPDERFFADVFDNREYQGALSYKADVVIDVGALAGEFSAYIYDKAQIIYALEPYTEHYKELESNIKEFELTKIKPFQVALSDTNGTENLTITAGRGGNRLDGIPGERVSTMTLATFMKFNSIEHVDILKIDIEDNEGKVFNSPDFEDVVDKISMVIGEHLGSVDTVFTGHGFIRHESNNNLIYAKV